MGDARTVAARASALVKRRPRSQSMMPIPSNSLRVSSCFSSKYRNFISVAGSGTALARQINTGKTVQRRTVMESTGVVASPLPNREAPRGVLFVLEAGRRWRDLPAVHEIRFRA